MKKSTVVPSKGSTGKFAARMAMNLIEECGDRDRDIILKSDQEPAIKFLVDDICTSRTEPCLVATAVYSNGQCFAGREGILRLQ